MQRRANQGRGVGPVLDDEATQIVAHTVSRGQGWTAQSTDRKHWRRRVQAPHST